MAGRKYWTFVLTHETLAKLPVTDLLDMMRYEGATVRTEWTVGWEFETHHYPTVARWRTFGVELQNVREYK